MTACIKCNQDIVKATAEVMKEYEGATADCPHCGALLIIKEGKFLDFHEYIHSENPKWPKDGERTGYIEIH
jgi:ssDNA-binding Zn-finger/Zn-ribbon topoisomerase 1